MCSPLLCASLRRRVPERTRPSNSACAGGSALSCPARTRLSSAPCAMFVSDQDLMLPCEHFFQKRISARATPSKLGGSIQRRADMPAEPLFCGRQRSEKLLQRHVVSDDEHVDVALRAIGALGD